MVSNVHSSIFPMPKLFSVTPGEMSGFISVRAVGPKLESPVNMMSDSTQAAAPSQRPGGKSQAGDKSSLVAPQVKT